jgi:tyrosyl-tRNA synthetase
MTSKSTAAEVERQLDVIRDGAVDCYGEEEFRTTLAEAIEAKRPLRVKLGMDPSAPDLHLGHTVVLQKLKRFQDLGHIPIFLIGDFTARIGDPSGKNKTRPALEPAEVAENAQTYVEQAGRVLDVERAEIRFNSARMAPLPGCSSATTSPCATKRGSRSRCTNSCTRSFRPTIRWPSNPISNSAGPTRPSIC